MQPRMEAWHGYLNQPGLKELHNVYRAAHYCQPLGNERFTDFIRDHYGVKPGDMGRGGRSHEYGCG